MFFLFGFGGEEDRGRMLAQGIAQLRKFGRVYLQFGRGTADNHAIEPGAEVEEESTRTCDHFLHQRPCLAEKLGNRLASLLRKLGERRAEFGAGAQAIGDEARHLVACAANASLGNVEREPRLPRDEAREFGAVGPLALAAAGLRAETDRKSAGEGKGGSVR